MFVKNQFQIIIRLLKSEMLLSYSTWVLLHLPENNNNLPVQL